MHVVADCTHHRPRMPSPKKSPPLADPVGATVNSAFITELETIYAKVLAHEKFKDPQVADALGFESMGARHGVTVGMQSKLRRRGVPGRHEGARCLPMRDE